MVPGAGVEPAQPKRPRDFKSLVSTNFTTRAYTAFYLSKEGIGKLYLPLTETTE